MGLSKLGEYINISDVRNKDNYLSAEDVVGLSTQKEIIRTKADLDGVNLSSYKLMPPNSFAYVPDTSRRGDKMSLAYNNTKNTYLVSSISIVFVVNRPDLLLSDYLFMYFNRPEFDRYSRFNSWGSARETFSWDEMCDIELSLPPLSVQQKYVDIYNAMVANQQCYESGLDDLKLTCDGYIEELRRNIPCEPIGQYINEINTRNTKLSINNIQGVNSNGQFGETKANTIGLDFHNYKIVRAEQFAYNPSRINLGSIALSSSEDCIVSPMYVVFEISDKEKLLPQYLMLWLTRKEFFRSTLFYAAGSVRDSFGFDVMQEVQIPIPDLSVQQSIANIFKVYTTRKNLNERMKAQIKDICPVLIKGSLDEANA